MALAGREDEAGPAARVRPGALSALLADIVRAPEPGPRGGWDEVLHPGAVIGRFELVRELGRGGFGVVYEARDRTLGRPVAFKALVAARPDVQEERLLREAEAAARLSHPNVVTLHDVGRTEHGPYLVLELLRGSTLAARLRQGPLTVREAVRVAVEVAKGLAHAHAQGVVHRDLTPGNVYLCDDGQVKLLDLGMAHAFGRRKLDGGTPAYMAPEGRRGAPEDERSDVFALGVVLHEMLAGDRPFPDDDGGHSLLGERSAPALEVPECPALGRLVSRMLERDPVRRPRDGAEVLAALAPLQAELAREPASARGERVRTRRSPRRAVLAAIAAVAVVAALLGVVVARRHAPAPPPPPSIAVLPFADMSPGRDQEYFSDGLSEEILNALAQVEGLHVAGRTSSFAFKGRNEDLREVGRKLNVGAVLEGSVRKAGNRVRITAQVVNIADGYHLWSETFDRELTDVFAVQDEIARAVVAALQVKLLPGRAPPKERPTASPEAYAHYLRGRQLYARYSPDGFRAAVEELERAVALDPEYAPAWAALSIPLFYSGHGEGVSADEGKARALRALAAAEKAVALDPELAEGYSARGYLRGSIHWDWAGAERDAERALALAPGDSTTQRRYGILQLVLGRGDRAREASRRALEIDPLFPANWAALASCQIKSGEYAAGRESLRRALEIAPTYEGLDFSIAFTHLLEGDAATALAAFERARSEPDRLMGVALAQHALGRAAEARRALDALVARYGDRKPGMVAGVYVFWGDRDRAFEWAERAVARHDDFVESLKMDPLAGRLRDDPRYAALLRRANLPPD